MDYKTEFDKFAISGGISQVELDHYYNQIENSMTPYILEERQMNVTQMDVFSRLMRDRILWVAGVIDDRMSTIVQAQLMFLDSTETQDITMHIDTPGGSVKSGLSIIDVMDYIKSDIVTVNTGMAASMGSVLLSSGTKGKRSSLVNSKVMLHQVSGGAQGNIQDTRISHAESERYNFLLFKRLGKNCGKDWKEVIETSKRDNWFDSQQAVEFGLIDEVIGDNTMPDMMEGFDEYWNNEVLPNMKR